MTRSPSSFTMLLSRHTRRRAFIAALGGAVAWPLVARAEQEHLRRIGVLMGIANDLEGQARVAAFRMAMQKLGWTEGRNIRVDYRWVGGDADRARADAAELAGMKLDIILANGTTSVAALRQETSTVPIVFVLGLDPVESGFVASLARLVGTSRGSRHSNPRWVANGLRCLRRLRLG